MLRTIILTDFSLPTLFCLKFVNSVTIMILEKHQTLSCLNPPMFSFLSESRPMALQWPMRPYLHQESANKEPDSKYISLYGPDCLCLCYSTLQWQHESSHRNHVNEWAWLCSSKILFIKMYPSPQPYSHQNSGRLKTQHLSLGSTPRASDFNGLGCGLGPGFFQSSPGKSTVTPVFQDYLRISHTQRSMKSPVSSKKYKRLSLTNRLTNCCQSQCV